MGFRNALLEMKAFHIAVKSLKLMIKYLLCLLFFSFYFFFPVNL